MTVATQKLTDYPKLECPFARRIHAVDKDGWQKHGKQMGLKNPEVYLVDDEIRPGYEWVFEDPDTIAIEKLNGTNIKLLTDKGRLIAVQNRKNVIDPLQIVKGKSFILEGIFMSIGKGYVKLDGEQSGELIGPKVQGNPYRLDLHEWYPFDLAIERLSYRSFHEYERTFANLSSWFRDGLFSRYYAKRASKLGSNEKVMAEGIVFYNLKRKESKQTWRAKLRRDMFDWHYSEKMKILK